MIFSLYIFDRHCEIVYYQDWHRSTPPTRAKPGNILPAVSPLVTSNPPPPIQNRPRGLNPSGGTVVHDSEGGRGEGGGGRTGGGGGLPFDEEAKLVYGVVLSLRNMVKKLTGSPQSLFHVYNTPSYGLHLFEAPTGLKFILLTSPGLDSKIVRSALRTMWGPNGAYGLWVVGNPEKGSGKEEKEGLDSEQFRTAVDNQMRSLPFFSS
ncbi:hypothetical protein BDY24DRAFT_396802 [Mrakia frigida]|uniref:TRAPP subunit BET5 n=1 Tax=Mrakia frigida TaxID=29902 RepID=UPI003FCC233C